MAGRSGADMWASRPREFFVRVGETKDVILLDGDAPTETVIHKLPGRKSAAGVQMYDRFETCAGFKPDPQGRPCQLCLKGERGDHVWVMSCIDATPFTTRHGNVVNGFRKLLLVPSGEHQRFAGYADAAGGTFRGLALNMEKTDRRVFGKVTVLGVVTEDEILGEFGRPGWTTRDGVVEREDDEDCYPYRYETFVAPPSVDDLATRHGGGEPNPGSKEAARAAFGDDWE